MCISVHGSSCVCRCVFTVLTHYVHFPTLKRSQSHHTHMLSLPPSLLSSLSLCAVPFIVMTMNAPTISEEQSRYQRLNMCMWICVRMCACVCVRVYTHPYVLFSDATTHLHTHTHTHISPHLPQSMRFPYWFNPQTQDQLQSVFTSIVIWPGLWGLISSQFHPVGPFISGPKLIHQRLKARQEKPCEERG